MKILNYLTVKLELNQSGKKLNLYKTSISALAVHALAHHGQGVHMFETGGELNPVMTLFSVLSLGKICKQCSKIIIIRFCIDMPIVASMTSLLHLCLTVRLLESLCSTIIISECVRIFEYYSFLAVEGIYLNGIMSARGPLPL